MAGGSSFKVATAGVMLASMLIFNVSMYVKLEEEFKAQPTRVLFVDSSSKRKTMVERPPPRPPEPQKMHNMENIDARETKNNGNVENKGNILENTSCDQEINIDFFGSDIKGTSAENFGECCSLCQQNRLCGAFSFVVADKSCWLKRPDAALRPSNKDGVNSGKIVERLPKPPAPAPKSLSDPGKLPSGGFIPVLIITYNRPRYLRRTLESILKAIPEEQSSAFPIIVSQQGNHKGVSNVIKEFQNKIRKHLRFEYKDNGKRQKGYEAANWLAYYKMTSHYGFAIKSTFDLDSRYKHLIVMEDDLDVAPDFFEFFTMASGVLDSDETLYCASAWNDNGMAPLVKDNRALKRTEVFPGLGWMISKNLWDEIERDNTWPLAFWDEAMREPQIRKGRSCLYPEVNRVYTFGSQGNSQAGGTWWRQFLEPILLNGDPVPWLEIEARQAARGKQAYDAELRESILKAQSSNLQQAKESIEGHTSLVVFNGVKEFQKMAKQLQILHEYKEGRPRAGYCGVVEFWSPGGGRIILAHTDTVNWAKTSSRDKGCDTVSKLK